MRPPSFPVRVTIADSFSLSHLPNIAQRSRPIGWRIEVTNAAKSTAITANTTHSDVNESKSHFSQRARPSLVRVVLDTSSSSSFWLLTAGGERMSKKAMTESTSSAVAACLHVLVSDRYSTSSGDAHPP